MIVGADEDDCVYPPELAGASGSSRDSMSPSSLPLESAAELVSEADLDRASSLDEELRSRTKCTGICQSESSANGFLPSKASVVSAESVAGVAIDLPSPDRRFTNEGEPLETDAAVERELPGVLGEFVVVAGLLEAA